MITPKSVNLKGVIGGTFQWSFTLYQSEATDNYRGLWRAQTNYSVNDCVLCSTSIPCRAIEPSIGEDPTQGGNWQQLATLDLTGWTGELTLGSSGEVTSAATAGGTTGTVAVMATAAQTATLLAGSQHICVSLTDTGGNVFFPISGSVEFVIP